MSKVQRVRCITINTDASYSSKYKIGTYAFYIVCDTFKIKSGGIFKCAPSNPMEAEMMCMANALHTLLVQHELPQTSILVINSDCLFSFQHITRKSKLPIGRKVASILKQVRNRTLLNGCIMPKYEFRHVKAHNGTPDARSHVNEWCDREAKRWMGIALQNTEPIKQQN